MLKDNNLKSEYVEKWMKFSEAQAVLKKSLFGVLPKSHGFGQTWVNVDFFEELIYIYMSWCQMPQATGILSVFSEYSVSSTIKSL